MSLFDFAVCGSRARGVRTSAMGIAATSVVLASGLLAAPASAHPPKPIKLKGGTFTITFSAAANAIFTENKPGAFAVTNTVTAITPTTAPKAGAFAFPISSGKINPKTVVGRVGGTGAAGLNFTHTTTLPFLGTNTTQFSLTAFVLHLGGSQPSLTVTFNGANTVPNEAIATIVMKHVHHSRHGHSFTLSKLTLKLNANGQSLFNQGMGAKFTVGETLGTVSVSAKT